MSERKLTERKSFEGNADALRTIKDAHAKFARLACESVAFDPMGIVRRIFADSQEQFEQLLQGSTGTYYRQVLGQERCVIVVPFLETATTELRKAYTVSDGLEGKCVSKQEWDALYNGPHEQLIRDCPPPLREGRDLICRGLAIDMLYPRKLNWRHHYQTLVHFENYYRNPSEAFYCTPSSLKSEVAYQKVVARFRKLYDLMMTLHWQHHFATYFIKNLLTGGQVQAVWPQLSHLMLSYHQTYLGRHKPTAIPTRMKKELSNAGLSRDYVATVLEEIVVSTTSSRLIEFDSKETQPSDEEGVIECIEPCWVDASALLPHM